jgi:hypothetical protein
MKYYTNNRKMNQKPSKNLARKKKPLTKNIVSGGISVVPSGFPESLRSRDLLPSVVNFSTIRDKFKNTAK